MNRVDELTLRLIDGELSNDEQAELEQLLSSNEARERHLALLAVESALRASGRVPDVAEKTLKQVQAENADDLERSVMRAISAMPAPEWQEDAAEPSRTARAGKSWRARATEWMAVALVVAGVMLIVQAWRTTNDPVVQNSPIVLRKSGELISSGGKQLDVGERVRPGTTLETTGLEDHAVLRYPDGTDVELLGPATVRIEQTAAEGKQVKLQSGVLQADVAKQPAGRPLIIATPHTDVRVLGTRFEIVAEKEQGTRIDLESGRIELVRGNEPPVTVEPNFVAVVPAGPEPIIVKPRPDMLVDADREVTLSGGRFARFQPDGQTILAATSWQAVYLHPDDRMETIPVRPQNRKGGRSGIRIWRQSGKILGFEDNIGKQLVMWDAESREVVRELPKENAHERGRSLAEVSCDGTWMATFEEPNAPPEFALWREGTSEPQMIRGPKKISSMAADPTGRLLAVGRRNIGNRQGNGIELVNAKTGRQVALLPVNRSHPICLTFSADGRYVAVGVTGAVQVWDVETHEQVASLEQPGVPIIHVALSPDGQRVAASSQGANIWLWRVSDKDELGVIHAGKKIRDLAFSPDGKRLAVVRSPEHLTVWDLTRFKTGGSEEASHD